MSQKELNVDTIMKLVVEAMAENVRKRYHTGYATKGLFEDMDGNEKGERFDVYEKIWMACDLVDLDERCREVIVAAVKLRSIPLRSFQSMEQCSGFLEVLLPEEGEEMKQKVGRLAVILFHALR